MNLSMMKQAMQLNCKARLLLQPCERKRGRIRAVSESSSPATMHDGVLTLTRRETLFSTLCKCHVKHYTPRLLTKTCLQCQRLPQLLVSCSLPPALLVFPQDACRAAQPICPEVSGTAVVALTTALAQAIKSCPVRDA